MDTGTLIFVAIGAGAAYWVYTTTQTNKRQQTMMTKHDKPRHRQRVNEQMNNAQSRHNIAKSLLHNPLGKIDDRYIKPF